MNRTLESFVIVALLSVSLTSATRARDHGVAGQAFPIIEPDLLATMEATLAKFPDLNAWIRIAPNGRVTVFTGKAELGTGIKTAIAQLAADELDITVDRVDLITADTALTPNEGVTAGSQTLEQSGTAVANAAANVRLLLAEAAAARWGVSATDLFTRDGEVLDSRGRRVIVHRAVAAVDSGEAVNPDGIRNQVEGGIVQSLSWTAYEAAGHDGTRRTDYDWSTYPILRFGDAPLSIAVEIIDRPASPFLGTGECAQGPTAAALANALVVATGKRLRSLPLAREGTRPA